MKPFKDLGFPE